MLLIIVVFPITCKLEAINVPSTNKSPVESLTMNLCIVPFVILSAFKLLICCMMTFDVCDT